MGVVQNRKAYPEEDRLDFSTILAPLFLNRRVEDVFGRDAGVRDALVVAHHPDENVRNAVLWLDANEMLPLICS